MYRSCDDVWTFVVKNPQFKMEGPTATTYVSISVPSLPLLSLSSSLFQSRALSSQWQSIQRTEDAKADV